MRELVDALTAASPDFRRMWSEHPVRPFTPVMKQFQHPLAGRIAFRYTKLTVAEEHTQQLVVFLPASPADTQAMRELARCQ